MNRGGIFIQQSNNNQIHTVNQILERPAGRRLRPYHHTLKNQKGLRPALLFLGLQTGMYFVYMVFWGSKKYSKTLGK